MVDVRGECADAAAASQAAASSLTAPGNTFALMSGGLKSLGTKFGGVSNSSPKPAAHPQQAAGGSGSYMGPSALEGGQGGLARQDSAASAVAAVEAVSAQRAAGATGFDRYGRPLGGGVGMQGATPAGDLDLGTINDIIANLEGGGAAGRGEGVPADASARSVPSGAAPVPQPHGPAQPGAPGLGLIEARPAAPPPADDDARCKLCSQPCRSWFLFAHCGQKQRKVAARCK